MPEPLTTKINDWRIVYSHIWSDLYNAHNHLNYAAEQAAAENWDGLSTQLGMVATYIYNAAYHFKGGSPNLYTAMYYGMDWIDDNWPGDIDEYELTMQKILDAVWVSTPLETFFFVNDIDAMRAAIWNKEISVERLHELYRHFSI